MTKWKDNGLRIIHIHLATRERLKKLGSKGETYESIILRLMEKK